MKFNGTKGPWKLTPDGDANFYGIQKKGNWLMRIQHNGEQHVAEQVANMKLIAAAPDLLKACVEALKHHQGGHSEIGMKLRRAIEKATQ